MKIYGIGRSQGGAIKSTPLHLVPEEAWKAVIGASVAENDLHTLYQNVGYLYRAVELRCQAVGAMPLSWRRVGSEEVLEQAPQFTFAWKPKHLLNYIEGQLLFFGAGYIEVAKNAYGKGKMLKPLLASSITPQFEAAKGLTGFRRSLGAKTIDYKPDELLYTWLPARNVEVGHGVAPVRVAAQTARNLFGAIDFETLYYQQAPIAPTLVQVEGMPPAQEIEKLENWITRSLSGLKNAFRARVIRTDLKVHQLQPIDLSTLRMEEGIERKNEDILAVLGVPLSLVKSNAANYATAVQDTVNFYDQTIVPECELIVESLNEQLFNALGYELIIEPHKLEIYTKAARESIGAAVSAFNGGVASRNEARAMADLPALDGARGDLMVGETTTTEGDTVASPVGLSAAEQIFGYHIEQGVVSKNEARERLGLAARDDDSNDEQLQRTRSLLNVMSVAVAMGIDIQVAAKLVGLKLPGDASGDYEPPPASPPPAPAPPPAPDVVPDMTMDEDGEDDTDDLPDVVEDALPDAAKAARDEAWRKFEQFAMKRWKEGKPDAIAQFDSPYVSAYALEIIADGAKVAQTPAAMKAVIGTAAEWAEYP